MQHNESLHLDVENDAQSDAKQGEHRMCLLYSTAQTNDYMGLVETSGTSVFGGNLQTSTESTVRYEHHLCDLGSAVQGLSSPTFFHISISTNPHSPPDPQPVRKTLRPRLGSSLVVLVA